jgi:hypothetical protein
VSDGEGEEVGHRTAKGNGTFVTDHKDFVGCAIGLNHGFHLTDDGGVDTTTQTLICSEWHEEPLLGNEVGLFLGEVGLVLDDALNGTHTETLGTFEPSNVLLHLGSGHHLHGLNVVRYTLVIFLIDSTAFMRILICLRFFVAKLNWFWKSRLEAPCSRFASIIN